mmetsp:Transcript_52728/g.146387  ORF Transcript_52728/g.146387 Transcript_52728/m.146387 type:complete len:343 (+) Transcript_52728:198-1226(+)
MSLAMLLPVVSLPPPPAATAAAPPRPSTAPLAHPEPRHAVSYRFASASTVATLELGAATTIGVGQLKERILRRGVNQVSMKKRSRVSLDTDLIIVDERTGLVVEHAVPAGAKLIVKRIPVERGDGVRLEGPRGVDSPTSSSSSHTNTDTIPASGKRALEIVLARGSLLRPQKPRSKSRGTYNDRAAHRGGGGHPGRVRGIPQRMQLANKKARLGEPARPTPLELPPPNCALCHHLPIDAVSIACCGHTVVCDECASEAFDRDFCCPLCGTSGFKEDQLAPNLVIRHRVDDHQKRLRDDVAAAPAPLAVPPRDAGVDAHLDLDIHGEDDDDRDAFYKAFLGEA